MKPFLFILCLIAGTAAAQDSTRYEYAEVFKIMTGPMINQTLQYDFGLKYADSAKFYSKLKLKSIIDGVNLLESKGWEVFTINSYTLTGSTVTSAYLRRRRR